MTNDERPLSHPAKVRKEQTTPNQALIHITPIPSYTRRAKDRNKQKYSLRTRKLPFLRQ